MPPSEAEIIGVAHRAAARFLRTRWWLDPEDVKQQTVMLALVELPRFEPKEGRTWEAWLYERLGLRLIDWLRETRPFLARQAGGGYQRVPRQADIDWDYYADHVGREDHALALVEAFDWYRRATPTQRRLGREDGRMNGNARIWPGQPLTPAEKRVLLMLARGHDNNQIGRLLQKSAETAKSQSKAIRLKLGAKNTTHAVAIAYDRGILMRGASGETTHRAA